VRVIQKGGNPRVANANVRCSPSRHPRLARRRPNSRKERDEHLDKRWSARHDPARFTHRACGAANPVGRASNRNFSNASLKGQYAF